MGGIPAVNGRGERLLLHIGIIDILQSYRWEPPSLPLPCPGSPRLPLPAPHPPPLPACTRLLPEALCSPRILPPTRPSHPHRRLPAGCQALRGGIWSPAQ